MLRKEELSNCLDTVVERSLGDQLTDKVVNTLFDTLYDPLFSMLSLIDHRLYYAIDPIAGIYGEEVIKTVKDIIYGTERKDNA